MVSIDGLTVEFGGTTLFKDISFVINEKDRIALMGKNGAGKSTLLKILAGVISLLTLVSRLSARSSGRLSMAVPTQSAAGRAAEPRGIVMTSSVG